MCGNYSREETIQGRKLYEEIRYIYIYYGSVVVSDYHLSYKTILWFLLYVLILLYILLGPFLKFVREKKGNLGGMFLLIIAGLNCSLESQIFRRVAFLLYFVKVFPPSCLYLFMTHLHQKPQLQRPRRLLNFLRKFPSYTLLYRALQNIKSCPEVRQIFKVQTVRKFDVIPPGRWTL